MSYLAIATQTPSANTRVYVDTSAIVAMRATSTSSLDDQQRKPLVQGFLQRCDRSGA
jgi:hypothetical protein